MHFDTISLDSGSSHRICSQNWGGTMRPCPKIQKRIVWNIKIFFRSRDKELNENKDLNCLNLQDFNIKQIYMQTNPTSFSNIILFILMLGMPWLNDVLLIFAIVHLEWPPSPTTSQAYALWHFHYNISTRYILGPFIKYVTFEGREGSKKVWQFVTGGSRDHVTY